MSSYQYRKYHCGDKTVARSSYLHNGISYTGKMAALYWDGPQGLIYNHSLSYTRALLSNFILFFCGLWLLIHALNSVVLYINCCWCQGMDWISLAPDPWNGVWGRCIHGFGSSTWNAKLHLLVHILPLIVTYIHCQVSSVCRVHILPLIVT